MSHFGFNEVAPTNRQAEFIVNRDEYLREYEVQSLVPNVKNEQAIKDLDADLPSDTHLVYYVDDEGQIIIDAVRAYKRVDIFDAYYDAGFGVLDIRVGYGRIKPKLYTPRDLTAASNAS